MKKLLLSLAFVIGLMAPVMAEDAPDMPYAFIPGTDIGLTNPFDGIDFCPYVHSVTTKDEMVGADMRFMGWPGLPKVVTFGDKTIVMRQNVISVNAGYITSFKANGMPYGSVSIDLLKLTTRAPEFFSYVAVGYAKDFKGNQDHLIINTAIPLSDIFKLLKQ